mmetsp:Transcript_18518/g.58787  ORF Transcript_18518/g.58787 Transcript_18518/m.58787 type:complete len:209 (-) Transcript_18518:32-658(-)
MAIQGVPPARKPTPSLGRTQQLHPRLPSPSSRLTASATPAVVLFDEAACGGAIPQCLMAQAGPHAVLPPVEPGGPDRVRHLASPAAPATVRRALFHAGGRPTRLGARASSNSQPKARLGGFLRSLALVSLAAHGARICRIWSSARLAELHMRWAFASARASRRATVRARRISHASRVLLRLASARARNLSRRLAMWSRSRVTADHASR